MIIRQQQLHSPQFTDAELNTLTEISPQLVLVFAAVEFMRSLEFTQRLRQSFPNAALVGCSTAGEIHGAYVSDHSASITALHFQHPDFRIASTSLNGMEDSSPAGERLAEQLKGEGLHDIIVFGQGVNINGSALIQGIRQVFDGAVSISGGLAGDGGAFQQTWVLSPQGASDQTLVGIGFYGPHLQLHHGSFGGWQPFGPARKVTRCSGNILFELDGEPALKVYKDYLGEYAKDLPASGLLFPFEMLEDDHNAVGLVRTILGIDEASGSLILAGDVIENGYLKLMHASTDALVDGAQAAAEAAHRMLSGTADGLTLLISCVGRKLVMGGRVDEEIEAVADVFGSASSLTGFYSYGEISPFTHATDCRLHNQTMTITYVCEE